MTNTKRPQDAEHVRAMVSEGYAKIAQDHAAADDEHARAVGKRLGYSAAELDAVPEGANLGVGCGNPTAIDRLQAGETVVDLGSGAGFDALLAARQVGPSGRVIGVDMTDAMLDRARENARKAGADHVEFRKGQIEALPIEDGTVDAIISNCVINLSPEKERVYREAWRVLRPGGRIMISDIVLERELPAVVLDSIDAYIGCVGGASLRSEYLETIAKAGFSEVRIDREASFATAFDAEDPRVREVMAKLEISEDQAKQYADAVTSLQIYARK